MEKYWRKKVLVIEVEANYGVDASPVGAQAIPCIDVGIRAMEGQDFDRNHDTPWLGNAATIPIDKHMVITFKVELTGSGTAGTAPQFAPVLRALGLAQVVTPGSSVVYSPVSAGFDSATMHLGIDGIRFALRGARGTATMVVNASGIPMLECTLTGLWTQPTDQAAVTPDFSNLQKPLEASDDNTPAFAINSVALPMRSFSLDLGNVVEPRFLVNSTQIAIVDRAETISTQVEARALSAFDPFALAAAQSDVPLTLTHGTAAGNRFTLSVPRAQMMRPGQPTEAQGIMEWPLNLRPLPGSGNDQWTLTFD